jgi:hypothetical protein
MTKLVNRAKMTTATTGTGTLTLGSAVDGFQTFAAAGVANADVVRYVIEDGDAWEIGLGTYTTSGTTLTRGSIESSTGTALNLTGDAVVFVTAAGQDIVQPSDNVSTLTNDAGYTTNTGTVTSVGVTAGTGITVSGGPITSSGSITVTNAAPDQIVSLAGGSNVTVTGSYPNFTVAASNTNLGYTTAASAGTVTSSTGSNTTIPAATTSIAGLMVSTDKSKLDGIETGAEVNVGTNLGSSGTGGTRTITSSTGSSTNITYSAADLSAVPTSRTLTAGTGLTGGGDLSADRTIDADIATLAEAELGTDNTKLMTPLRVKQAAVLEAENRIINGAFDFWQRGTSGTGGGYVAADRWRNLLSSGTVTQSRQLHTLGDKFGSNTPQFYLRQTVSGQSGAGAFARINQQIEGVRSYAGETITVLGWARRSSGSGNMVVGAAQNFGTGGSPSATVQATSPTTITLTSDWEPFAAVLTVPSIAGKTIGTNNNDHVNINFWTSAGSDFDARTNSLGIQTIGVDLWGIHIRRGEHTAAATEAYIAPELGPELARCQRYFEIGAASWRFDGIYGGGGETGFGSPIFFAQTKRSVPSLTLLSEGRLEATSAGFGNITTSGARATWAWSNTAVVVVREQNITFSVDAEL